jgi:hypothetical protein
MITNMKLYIKSNKKLVAGWLSGIFLLSISGCKKTIDVGAPLTKLSSTTVFTTNNTAEAAIAGVFGKMAGSALMYNGTASVSLQQGQAADELISYSTTNKDFYTNSFTSQKSYYWTEIYQEMFAVNAAITSLTNADQLTPAIRNQLLGEMKFTRAFIYFYAVNLYGAVPMPLTTAPASNNTISRTSEQQVYVQIIQDLKDAQGLLSDNSYLNGTSFPTTDRVHPNKQAASAMLARVYLYQQDWVNAEAMAASVINASSYKLETINSVFLKTSKEAIWQLFPGGSGGFYNNADAQGLIVTARPSSLTSTLPLNDNLINAFENGDARLINWVGTFTAPPAGALPAVTYKFAYKYKASLLVTTAAQVTEYPIMLRLAEQYLIRAEARAQQGNIGGAQTDLNTIRTRAALPNTNAATKDELITAIAHERQVELFTEMGHRWFDLKRTSQIDAVMSIVAPQKGGGAWASYKQLLPIPASDILLNKKLTQTPGYN